MLNKLIEVGKTYKSCRDMKVKIVHYNDVMNDPTNNFYLDEWGNKYYENEVNKFLIEEWKELKSGVAYMNVYQSANGDVWEGSITGKKENVERWAKEEEKQKNIRLARIRVEWKEGQFDD